MKEEIKPDSKDTNIRRKLLTGIGILSLFQLFKMRGFFYKKNNSAVVECAPVDEKKTMKLLSQDGQLVEVDIANIKALQQKVSNKELQEWVKR